MRRLKFNRELYSKTALIKAAYNFTDIAYIHLDADDRYYYVDLEVKVGKEQPNELDFTNEMLAQSVRHEIFQQTKNIRELLYARAVASSVIVEESLVEDLSDEEMYTEDEILKDWFAKDETDNS